MPDATLLSDVNRALARSGFCVDDLLREAQAIALFGSRAAGCATPASDWDLLCIGAGTTRKLRGLDLVWVEPHALESSAWLGGDLASHVAVHGLWLEGEPAWDLDAVDFAAAARRKETRLVQSLRDIGRAWSLLGLPYQAKHATLLRRDAQRWRLLQRGLPIPPSAVLDESWAAEGSRDWLADTLLGLSTPPDLARALSGDAGLHVIESPPLETSDRSATR